MMLKLFRVNRSFVCLATLAVALSAGCGSSNSTSVAEPPQMTPEEQAESAKRQMEHYAAPSNADRMQSSN